MKGYLYALLAVLGSAASINQADAQSKHDAWSGGLLSTGPRTAHAASSIEARGGGAPANDQCSSVTPVALAVGSTVNFSGTTVGATDAGDYEPGSDLDGQAPSVWHAFTTTECAQVTVAYCGTPIIFGNVWIFLSPSCPAGNDYILASSYNSTSCADGNFSIIYSDLPAGTYYLPVMFDATDANGPYTISVSAAACGAYCAASALNANFEVINHVTFAGIDNATASTQGYEDHTGISATVSQGGSYPITITVDDGYPSDQVLVWIDFNGNQVFDANEQVLDASGAGPTHAGTVTVPANAALGQTRMRIRLQDTDFGPNSTPCGSNQYGQVQDYSVNIEVGTGLGEQAGTGIEVFPNPTEGDLTIRCGGLSGAARFELTDMTGRVVFSQQQAVAAGQTVTLPIAGKVAAGVYHLSAATATASSVQPVVVR